MAEMIEATQMGALTLSIEEMQTVETALNAFIEDVCRVARLPKRSDSQRQSDQTSYEHADSALVAVVRALRVASETRDYHRMVRMQSHR